MVNFIVLGKDGVLGGYERADVLLADVAVNGEPQAIWRRTNEMRTRFAPSSVAEVRGQTNTPPPLVLAIPRATADELWNDVGRVAEVIERDFSVEDAQRLWKLAESFKPEDSEAEATGNEEARNVQVGEP